MIKSNREGHYCKDLITHKFINLKAILKKWKINLAMKAEVLIKSKILFFKKIKMKMIQILNKIDTFLNNKIWS